MCLVSNPVYQVQLILNAIVHAGPPAPLKQLALLLQLQLASSMPRSCPLPPHRPVRPNARLRALAQVSETREVF